MMPGVNPQLMGWLGVDDIQRTFAAQFPALRQSSPRLFSAPPSHQTVCLYRAYYDVLGQDWQGYPSQEIGDCVSFGHGHGNDLLQCIAVGLGGKSGYFETQTEFIYGASREVAGILGGGDGSYGADAVKAMQQLGMVSRKMLGDSGTYSGARARQWGASGPPEEMKSQAVNFKLGAAALVSSWDEYCRSIQNGHPVTICSIKGFTTVRDAMGFCLPSGQWGHCMVCAGVRFDRPGALILQSWGPNVPTGPTTLGQPSWSFWVDEGPFSQMLAEGDSWALSQSPSFDPQKLPKAWTYGVAA